MSLSWLPATEYISAADTTGIDLYNGLPDGYDADGPIPDSVTDKLVYRTERQGANFGSPLSDADTISVFPEMPRHGLLFTDTIWAVGRGDIGARVLFATYQSG